MKTIIVTVSTALAFGVALLPGHPLHHPVRQSFAPLAPATMNQAYSQALRGRGGVRPYTWELVNDSTLPEGLKLDSATGLITGVPLHAGTSMLSSRISDSSKPAALTFTQQYRLEVGEAPLFFPATLLSNGFVQKRYSARLMAEGGTPPYLWTVSSGRLPDGLWLDSKTGIISGIALSAATKEFTIEVKDSSGDQQRGWQSAMKWLRSLKDPS